MEMEEALRLAQSDTQFIRGRKSLLYTFGTTRLPYVCISQSKENEGTVFVRTGEAAADRPQIAIPGEQFSFQGFHSEKNPSDEIVVMLARRISMPPSKYTNTTGDRREEPGPLKEAVERAMNRLDQQNDIRTAVIVAPDQVWNLSILLYIGSQVVRSAPSNVQEHMERVMLRGDHP